jgi:hypothetical protein
MQEANYQHTNLAASSLALRQEQQSSPKSNILNGYLGGMAGLLVEGALHPMDTVRTRIKANVRESVAIMTQIKTMHRHEGPLSYYRGFSCTLPGSFVTHGSYFFMYENLKQLFAQTKVLPRDATPFAAAFMSGFCSNMISLPFMAIRSRMQLKPGQYDYKHVIDGFRKVLKTEGFKKLYLSGPVFFTQNAMEAGLTFGFYELFHRGLKPLFPSKSEFNLPLTVVSSMAAASMTAFMINPLDVMVTRMQVMRHKPNNVYALVKSIYRYEGYRGFMKGVLGTMTQNSMAALILFPTYELLKSVYQVDLGA